MFRVQEEGYVPPVPPTSTPPFDPHTAPADIDDVLFSNPFDVLPFPEHHTGSVDICQPTLDFSYIEPIQGIVDLIPPIPFNTPISLPRRTLLAMEPPYQFDTTPQTYSTEYMNNIDITQSINTDEITTTSTTTTDKPENLAPVHSNYSDRMIDSPYTRIHKCDVSFALMGLIVAAYLITYFASSMLYFDPFMPVYFAPIVAIFFLIYAIPYCIMAFPCCKLPCLLFCPSLSHRLLADTSQDSPCLSSPYHTAICHQAETDNLQLAGNVDNYLTASSTYTSVYSDNIGNNDGNAENLSDSNSSLREPPQSRPSVSVHLMSKLTQKRARSIRKHQINVQKVLADIDQVSTDVPTLQFHVKCSHRPANAIPVLNMGGEVVTYSQFHYVPILHYRYLGLSGEDFLHELDSYAHRKKNGDTSYTITYHPSLLFTEEQKDYILKLRQLIFEVNQHRDFICDVFPYIVTYRPVNYRNTIDLETYAPNIAVSATLNTSTSSSQNNDLFSSAQDDATSFLFGNNNSSFGNSTQNLVESTFNNSTNSLANNSAFKSSSRPNLSSQSPATCESPSQSSRNLHSSIATIGNRSYTITTQPLLLDNPAPIDHPAKITTSDAAPQSIIRQSMYRRFWGAHTNIATISSIVPDVDTSDEEDTKIPKEVLSFDINDFMNDNDHDKKEQEEEVFVIDVSKGRTPRKMCSETLQLGLMNGTSLACHTQIYQPLRLKKHHRSHLLDFLTSPFVWFFSTFFCMIACLLPAWHMKFSQCRYNAYFGVILPEFEEFASRYRSNPTLFEFDEKHNIPQQLEYNVMYTKAQ